MRGKKKSVVITCCLLSAALISGCGSSASPESVDLESCKSVSAGSENVSSASGSVKAGSVSAESVSPEPVSTSSVSAAPADGNIIDTKYFSVTVPDGWKDKVQCGEDIIDGDDTSYEAAFYDAACMDAGVGGFLFGIGLYSSHSDYTVLPAYQYLGTVTGNDGMEYSLVVRNPSDVQFDDAHQNEYIQLADAEQTIISSISFKDGYAYTPSSGDDQGVAADDSSLTFADIYADYLGDSFDEDSERYNWTASAEGGMWESLGIRYDAGDGVQYLGASDPVGNMEYFGVKDGTIVAHIEPVNDQNLTMKDFSNLPLTEEPYFSEVPDDQGWSAYVYQIDNGYQAYFVIHYGDDTPWYEDYVMYVVSVTDKAYCSRMP